MSLDIGPVSSPGPMIREMFPKADIREGLIVMIEPFDLCGLPHPHLWSGIMIWLTENNNRHRYLTVFECTMLLQTYAATMMMARLLSAL